MLDPFGFYKLGQHVILLFIFFTHGRSKLHTPEPDPSESLALLSWSVGEMPTLHYNN